MSSTLWEKVLIIVRVWGRFFEVLPKTSNEASFFSLKNSRDAGSSKGWIAFFFVNFLASGTRRE
jgi:hypothetical protein